MLARGIGEPSETRERIVERQLDERVTAEEEPAGLAPRQPHLHAHGDPVGDLLVGDVDLHTRRLARRMVGSKTRPSEGPPRHCAAASVAVVGTASGPLPAPARRRAPPPEGRGGDGWWGRRSAGDQRLPAPGDQIGADIVGDLGGEPASLGQCAVGEDQDERVGAHAKGAVVGREAALDAPRDAAHELLAALRPRGSRGSPGSARGAGTRRPNRPMLGERRVHPRARAAPSRRSPV